MADLQTSTRLVHNSSSSTTTTINYPYSYDVFINHRGPDIKNTFASHLYYRLLSHGLQPFLDREELEAGEYLTCQIEGAIKAASVHIAVFSPGYADSKWCLDELVLILKSMATVIPVFYNVKPSDLRWTNKDGRYARALSIHEEKCRYDLQTLDNWRKALFDVSILSGLELETYNGDEGKLLDKVVRCVLKKRRKTALNVARYPTGLEEKVEDFEIALSGQQRKSGKAQVLGIVGLGGVGKTTLAKELFNRKSSYFDKCCFLFDVRETAGRRSLNSLQSKLLKDLTQLELQIDSIAEGIEMLRRYLSSSQVLVVLDDVDHADQLDAFLPLRDVLGSDSLILVTSRYKDVLTRAGIIKSAIYKLTGLSEQHSRQLFCSYAFCQPHPPLGFKDLVDEFLRACDGLPLSLKVFGALLCGMNDKSYWEGQLEKLRQIKLPDEIQKRLKISYHALDEEERQIFLDIACYFIGEDRDMAIRIWDGSGWKGLVGLVNLENKCLVELDRENRIQMHDHLRDLGRDIADQEMPHRLWRPTDNINDLWLQSQEIAEVRGIRTVPGVINDDYDMSMGTVPPMIRNRDVPHTDLSWFKSATPYRFKNLQLLATEDQNIVRRVKSSNLLWLRWYNCPHSCLPSWTPMKNLRVLDVVGNKLDTLWRRDSQAPLELRELNIYAPLLKFPKSIGQLKHIEKIVNYVPIKLETLPEEFCHLPSLKYLLLRCPCMESLPDSFGCLTNLQHLDLSHSWSLRKLPNSFGKLVQLKHLNLRCCYNLTMKNETFTDISKLEYLDLSNCQKIKVLPPQVVRQRSIEEIRLLSTHLEELPDDIGNLSNLDLLFLGSPLLETLPRSLGRLSSLKELCLEGCDRLECLPNSLGHLSQLSTMRIHKCGIRYLPAEMAKMNNLKELRVTLCPLRELPLKMMVEGEREKTLTDPTGRRELRKLESSIHNVRQQQCMYRLEYLELNRTEIWKISFAEGVCPNLKHFQIEDCNDLMEVGELPPSLITLKLVGCSQLRTIQGLCNLRKLQELNIGYCKEVEELPSLQWLISLEKLEANRCGKLKRIRGLEKLTKLQMLSVSSCAALEELSGVEELRSLEKLSALECPRLVWRGEAMEKLNQRLKEGIITGRYSQIWET